MIQFISTLDHCVRNLLEFTYGHAQNGEPCHRRLERIDTPDDHSLSLSQILNPKSVHQATLIRKRTYTRRPDRNLGAKNADHICACDPQYARYGDCCRSSPHFVPEEQRLGASPFTCTTPSITGIYVITTYPPNWKESDTRNRCEYADCSYRDPLLDAPVTSLSTNTTYRNSHCAYCHGDLDVTTMVIWDASFTCFGSDLPTLYLMKHKQNIYRSIL